MSSMRNYILGKVTKSVITSKKPRRLQDICCDIINADESTSLKALAVRYNLSTNTVLRMKQQTPAKSGAPYRPNAQTVENILLYSNARIEVLTDD